MMKIQYDTPKSVRLKVQYSMKKSHEAKCENTNSV